MDKTGRFALVGCLALFITVNKVNGQTEGLTSLRGRLGLAAPVEFA